jgi:hypothetical protein
MTPTAKRGIVALENKREARIPSLVADLASPDPAVRTKAREALVAIGKLTVPSLNGRVKIGRRGSIWRQNARGSKRSRLHCGAFGCLWARALGCLARASVQPGPIRIAFMSPPVAGRQSYHDR